MRVRCRLELVVGLVVGDTDTEREEEGEGIETERKVEKDINIKCDLFDRAPLVIPVRGRLIAGPLPAR